MAKIVVGLKGIEPNHSKRTDLQSAATLQLRRNPGSQVFCDEPISNFLPNLCVWSRTRTDDCLLNLKVLYQLSYPHPTLLSQAMILNRLLTQIQILKSMKYVAKIMLFIELSTMSS